MRNLELWRKDRMFPRSLFADREDIARDFDRFLQVSPAAPEWNALGDVKMPACEVQEDAKGFLLSFDVPGFKKEDLNVEVLGSQLVVSGKREREIPSSDAKIHRTERSYGEFKRTFSLPENVKAEALEANYENGVLYLALPKREIESAKRITIGESKGGFLKKLIGLKGEDEGKRAVNN